MGHSGSQPGSVGKGLVHVIAGVLLIIVGIIGLFLPLIQGILLIFAGLMLLGFKKEQIRGWFKKLKF